MTFLPQQPRIFRGIKQQWIFGREYLLPLFLLNGAMAWFITLHGLSALNPVIFPHALLFVLLYAWSGKFRNEQYFYYYNLGLGKRTLWGFIAMVDALAAVISIWIGYSIYLHR